MPGFKKEDVKQMFFFNTEEDESTQKLYEALKLEEGNADILKNCGFHGSRHASMVSLFHFFLMAREKPPMDFKQAIAMKPPREGFDQAMKEFLQFARDHQIRNVVMDEEKKAENIKAWTELFYNASEKMKSYRFPDIDYGDPTQVYQHKDELGGFIGGFINYSQEFRDSFFRSLGPDVKYVEQAVGGKGKFNDMMHTWESLGYIAMPLQTGYMPADIKEILGDENRRDVNFEMSCSQRYVLSRISNKFRGKSVNSLVTGMLPSDLYIADVGFGLSRNAAENGVDIRDNEQRFAYLKNQSRKRDELYREQYDHNMAYEHLKFNSKRKFEFKSLFTNHLEAMLKHGFADEMKKLFDKDPSPQELVRRAESAEFSEAVFKINELFDRSFESSHQDHLYTMLNERAINNFLIDGKSPKELWGKKYEFLNDRKKIENMYRIELMHEITSGNREIEATTWYLDRADKCHRTKPVSVIKSRETRNREIAVIVEMGNIHKELEEIRNSLLATQKDSTANLPDSDKKTGSELYRNMFRTLNKCIEASYSNNNNGNLNDLQNALKEYHKASAQYYKKRKGIMFAPRGNGKSRLDISKSVADSLLDKAERLKMLAGGLDLTPTVHDLPNENYSNYVNVLRHGAYEVEKSLPQRCDYRDAFRYSNHEATEDALNTHKQLMSGIIARQQKKKELRKSIKDTIDKMIFPEERLSALDDMVSEGDKKPVATCAKRCVLSKYLDRLNDPQVSMQELGKIEKDIKPDKIRKEVTGLIESPVFCEVVAKCPKTYGRKWKKIEKDASDVRDDFERNKDIISGELNEMISKYCGEEIQGKESVPVSKDTQEMIDMKAGQLVAMQILTQSHNPDIMRAVAADPKNFKLVMDTSMEHMKKVNLAGDMDNLAAAVDGALKDGSFMKDVIGRLAAQNPDRRGKEEEPIIRELVAPRREIKKELRVPGAF